MRNTTMRSAEKVLNDDECFEIIRKKLRQDSMDEYSLVAYEVVPVQEVNGFMGQYFSLKATIARPESPSDTRSIMFFTKIPPPSTSPQYEFSAECGSFKKEVALYTTLFPEVLSGSTERCIPRCFLGVEDGVIVLEDMAHSGFVMADKFRPLDFEHCEVTLRTMARFHARSLIFETRCGGNLNDRFSHCMHETLWPLKDGRPKNMFDAAVKGTASLIDMLPGLEETEKLRFKRAFFELTVHHIRKLSPSKTFKNVLCHGDLWANNILFKYDEERKPTECCLIDFQLARYNPPAHDLMCFLQFTTTRKTRDEHFGTFLEIYYDSVASAVKEANLDVASVFPWDEFMSSIRELRVMCMAHGLLNTPIMLLDSSAVNKYFTEQPQLLESALYADRTPLVCHQFQEFPKYRERMIDALLELRDYLCNDKAFV